MNGECPARRPGHGAPTFGVAGIAGPCSRGRRLVRIGFSFGRRTVSDASDRTRRAGRDSSGSGLPERQEGQGGSTRRKDTAGGRRKQRWRVVGGRSGSSSGSGRSWLEQQRRRRAGGDRACGGRRVLVAMGACVNSAPKRSRPPQLRPMPGATRAGPATSTANGSLPAGSVRRRRDHLARGEVTTCCGNGVLLRRGQLCWRLHSGTRQLYPTATRRSPRKAHVPHGCPCASSDRNLKAGATSSRFDEQQVLESVAQPWPYPFSRGHTRRADRLVRQLGRWAQTSKAPGLRLGVLEIMTRVPFHRRGTGVALGRPSALYERWERSRRSPSSGPGARKRATAHAVQVFRGPRETA